MNTTITREALAEVEANERRQTMPAAPLPSPNAAQEKAIQRTVAIFGYSSDIELLGWTVIDPGEFLIEGEEPKGLYVEFSYQHYLNSFDRPPGREVSVFAADGAVISSQDFG